VTSAANLTVQDCILSNNTATFGGGGLEIDNNAATATITDSLFSGNLVLNGSGGGVEANNAITLTVTGSTFTGNRADGPLQVGGGLNIATSGTNAAGTASSLVNDTITGNSASNKGGGLEFDPGGGAGDLNLTSDTITGNVATVNGGGVRLPFAGNSVVFLDTIVAGNSVTDPAKGADISNTAIVISKGGNFIGDDTTVAAVFPAGTPNANGDFAGTTANPLNPLLGPLQNNGGRLAGAPGDQQVIPTEALLAGSPAIGTGVSAGSPATDQRGLPRIPGHTDIGAFSIQAPASKTMLDLQDVTGKVQVTRVLPQHHKHHHGKANPQVLTFRVTNVSGADIVGPVYLVLDGLSGGVVLKNASGFSTTHVTPGDPFVVLTTGPLPAGQSVLTTLLFSSARKKHMVKAVNFNLFVLAGPGVV
jgi:hypothetical protein